MLDVELCLFFPEYGKCRWSKSGCNGNCFENVGPKNEVQLFNNATRKWGFWFFIL